MPNDGSHFVVDLSTMPPSCLPSHINSSDLIEVTRIGDQWKRYFDPKTGQEHDGALYAWQMRLFPAKGGA
jgi:hypothetical protein